MTQKEIQMLDGICSSILRSSRVRFVGVISKMGRLVAGGFRAGVTPHIEEEKIRMMYMQLVLDVSMRKDFDEYLGPTNYILCERRNVTMISIPRRDFLILIFLEPKSSFKRIVNKTFELIKEVGFE